MIHLALILVSVILFVIAAIWQPAPPRVSLLALGLAFFAAAFLPWHG